MGFATEAVVEGLTDRSGAVSSAWITRAGGFGRLSVLRPVVLARYGTGGGAGSSSAASVGS